MSVKKFVCALGLCMASITVAKASLVTESLHLLPYSTNVSFMAADIGAKQPLIEHNAKQKMIPASTQKLIVALAAMLSLGPDYRFSTTLEITDKPVNGVLNGDVVIHFSGDPSFTKQK